MNCGMSAFGPQPTWALAPHMSAFRGKADMPLDGSCKYRGRTICETGYVPRIA
jgi:hypothetical protein